MITEKVSLNRVLQHIKANEGAVMPSDLDILVVHCPLRQVLVRCNNGRFLCAAQDVRHFVAIIERDYGVQGPNAVDVDYIRDITLPSSDPIWK